jgi:hypothetical protein
MKIGSNSWFLGYLKECDNEFKSMTFINYGELIDIDGLRLIFKASEDKKIFYTIEEHLFDSFADALNYIFNSLKDAENGSSETSIN